MKIKNIKIVNFNKTIENASIEFENGFITKITETKGISKYILIPGFIDSHIHGFYGHDVMDSKDAISNITLEIAKQGTTSYYPTGITGPIDKMTSFISNVYDLQNKNIYGSRILGSHMEGPFISLFKKGAHNPKWITQGTKKEIDALLGASKNTLKKLTVAPEVISEVNLKYIISKGVIANIGHSNATYLQTQKAIENGAVSSCHMWNAMSGVVNRNPGMVEALLLNKNIYSEHIFDFVHVDRITSKLSIESKGTNRIVAITDSIRPAGLSDGESESGGFKILKKGNTIKIKDTDTIAGSAATMHNNFINIMSLGYSINESVAMTSYNCAQNMNEKKLGFIGIGFKADFLLLDDNLNVKTVYVNGKEIK
ncbi:MAG: N-acetylglucosamine-6-phosphate deacetylase [Mollicutes bacterium PWAP]|nr:N-acetylglucosamine-6-phosphate deacetylase [Mollicutes bacterium PWAP]